MPDLEIRICYSYNNTKTYKIHNCPIKEKWWIIPNTVVTFSHNRVVTINKTLKLEIPDSIYQATNFLIDDGMHSKDFQWLFKEVFKFVPYFTVNTEGNMVYDPTVDYKTEKELYARRLEPEIAKFMDIQIYSAIVRMMPKVIREHATDTVPEYLEDVYVQTLTKLWGYNTLTTLRELAVLDYFGLLDLINVEYVVHGDQLLLVNSRNLAIAGYADSCGLCVVKIQANVKLAGISIAECELLSDAIIKTLKLYDCNMDYRDGKITPFESRIMTYLIKNNVFFVKK